MLLILSLIVSITLAEITNDYACTKFDGEAKYNWQAVGCVNRSPDETCEAYYPSINGADYPKENGNTSRPLTCWSTGGSTPVRNEDIIAAAIYRCPKTCGYCCQTKPFSCADRGILVNCSTVSKGQCQSAAWRKVLIQECPASCGLCEYANQCVDTHDDCVNQSDICTNPQLQDFVNYHCKKTCNRCYATSN